MMLYFNVFLNGKIVDTVGFEEGVSMEDIRKTLILQDKHSNNIVILPTIIDPEVDKAVKDIWKTKTLDVN